MQETQTWLLPMSEETLKAEDEKHGNSTKCSLQNQKTIFAIHVNMDSPEHNSACLKDFSPNLLIKWPVQEGKPSLPRGFVGPR